MAFLSSLGTCAVMCWFESRSPLAVRVLLIGDPASCRGRIEVAHLSLGKTAGRRRAPDELTAPICHADHVGIDGGVGGKAPWYVGLGYDGQQELRRWLIDWATAKWDALSERERERWRRLAQEQHEGSDT